MRLSHSIKITCKVSLFRVDITRKTNSSFHHKFHLTTNQPLPRHIPTYTVQNYASSSKNNDSDNHMQSLNNNAKSNSISNHPACTAINFKNKQEFLRYLDHLLKNNSSDVIETAEKYLFMQHSLVPRPLIAGTLAYQKVLDAWCKVRNFDRAELLLDQIHRNYINKKCRIVPDRYQFQKILFRYQNQLTNEARIGNYHEYATKIENLIQKMKEWHEQYKYKTKPKSLEYQILFSSMIYYDKPDPEKAENIFRDMIKQYDTNGDERMKPTTSHVMDILRLWNLSKQENAGVRSWALYTEAKKRSIPLNGYCYLYLLTNLNACSRYESAEIVYDEIESLFRAGDTSMKPTIRTMINMLNVRSKTGNPTGAQQVFTEMLKEWRVGGNLHYKPTIMHFNLLLMAWYNSDHSNAAENAHEWVRKLNQISTDPSLRPNSTSYAVVVKCYNRSNNLKSGKYLLDLYEEVKQQQNFDFTLILFMEVLAALMKSYSIHKNVVNGEDIVNDDTHHVVAIVDLMKQILTKDVHQVPGSIWQKQGVWFCNAVTNLLRQYKVPDWEKLTVHVETKLLPKAS